MRTVELDNFGWNGLTWKDRPVPQPGPGDVLVRMEAFSLNYRDLLVIQGKYNPRLKLPLVPFSDGSGEVVEAGPDVVTVKPGDRVAGAFMQGWIEGSVDEQKARTAMGAGLDGVGCEYRVFPEPGLVHLPDYLSYEEAATLPCAAVTAWNALFASGSVKPGDVVLTLGTGGVSIFALQLAAMAGARVIVTSSQEEKITRARELGAQDGVNYTATPEWDKRVQELTGGRGADHVVEVGGAGTLAKSIKAVRMGGTISLIGSLAEGSDVNPRPILMRSVRVQGIFVGSRTMFQSMLSAMEVRQFRPVIDTVFSADQLPEALDHMRQARHFGKIVVRFR